jgi:hypothetical protein
MGKKRQEITGIFTVEYTKSSLPELTPEQHIDVKYQLEDRYFSPNPHYKPTRQERSWGITEIPPGNTYWLHLRLRLPKIIEILRNDPLSNKAVITIDYPDDPPCHQCFQFKVRDGVEMTSYARSLDIEEGLPRDSHIFWYAGVEVVSKALKISCHRGKLQIVSAGAHKYVYTD